jgi:hypothetical protein
VQALEARFPGTNLSSKRGLIEDAVDTFLAAKLSGQTPGVACLI